jgi:23S rRNA pseudouridine2605 synthase
MRINKFVAAATGLSRRAADEAVGNHRVLINNQTVSAGAQVDSHDVVSLDGTPIELPKSATTIVFNKPAGYVCSRSGQGSQTIYDILPAKFHHLKPVGRLDKDSSGLLLLTNDGDLANQLTHPRYTKTKIYEVLLDKPLQPLHQQMISDHGIQLDDGPSKFSLASLDEQGRSWQVTMQEGRNRQIRRTFACLGYNVKRLHRTSFGPYKLSGLLTAEYKVLPD